MILLITLIYNSPNMMKITHFLKIAFFSLLAITAISCGENNEEWYSYQDENLNDISVKVISAEITSGPENDNKDIVKVEMIWKNDNDVNVAIDNEKFGLYVLDVRINPEGGFSEINLAAEEEKQETYTFLVLRSIIDKATYKLVFEDWAELPIYPTKK